MDDPVELTQLESCDGETLRQLYAIYTTSIAVREQKPEAWIATMIGAPEYRVWIAKEGGLVRGFSILFLPATDPASLAFALLEYMAVAPDQRNRGLGGELFRRSVDHAVTPEGRRVPVLLEIDSDREPSSDRAMRTRRERFYRRLGCARIGGLRYLMPLPGEGPAPQMDLMVYSLESLGRLRRSELERWLRTIYRDVYRCSPDDPRIGQMLHDLPDPLLME
jgi:GNAT superfamily N-acetyltransferase